MHCLWSNTSNLPRLFELGVDNGKNRVVDKYNIETAETISIGETPEELYECVKTAVEICPVAAIKIVK